MVRSDKAKTVEVRSVRFVARVQFQPRDVAVQVTGSTLTVTPAAGFTGDVWVLVGATDDAANPINNRFVYQYFKLQVTA